MLFELQRMIHQEHGRPPSEPMPNSSCARALSLLTVLGLAACGGSDVPTGPDTSDPVATTVAVSPASVALSAAGQTRQLTATVLDQRGDPMAGEPVVWTSSEPSVAIVDSTGLVTATGLGTASVTATSGLADGTVAVVIQDAIVAPSFSTVVNEIFQRRGCSAGNCHGSDAGGLTLTASAATNYAELVNVPSTDVPTLDRVTPGSAADSYLVRKLEGTGSGARMPLGGRALGTADLQAIKDWINAGAPEN
jgi:hypothetical protein